jgi:hypothetical protein
MPAGYSGTPLPTKLGIKEGHTVGVLAAPDDFRETLGELPVAVDLHSSLRASDIFVVFATARDQMERRFRRAMTVIPPEGAIWVAWPKRSSGVETDLTEDTMRELFLPTGMVDNKVCAIDVTWSGLRFVVRRENRKSWGGGTSR